MSLTSKIMKNRGEYMKILLTFFSMALLTMVHPVQAQWNNWGMPGSSPYGAPTLPGMPFSGGYAQPQYPPQPQPFNMMPFAQPAPTYRPAPAQPFGGMMPFTQPQPRYQAPQQPFGGMMPFSQPQPRYQAPASQPYMMPGMEQGIRSMMQPGKIMAEEATPGMYMKPTWR